MVIHLNRYLPLKYFLDYNQQKQSLKISYRINLNDNFFFAVPFQSGKFEKVFRINFVLSFAEN